MCWVHVAACNLHFKRKAVQLEEPLLSGSVTECSLLLPLLRGAGPMALMLWLDDDELVKRLLLNFRA
jgi:hypothetical protein